MTIVQFTSAAELDAKILWLFKMSKMDTAQIAQELGMKEYRVAHRLAIIRDRIYADVVESLPA